jgi:hypothetical protein
MNTAKSIAATLTDRLAAITVANGYLTDIGTHVYRGRRTLDETMIPCVVVVEGADSVAEQIANKTARVVQRYDIEGHAECDPDNPNDKAHDIIFDLKRAIFSGDMTFGGPVRKVEYKGRAIVTREDGFNAVAAAVSIDMTFSENLNGT